MRRTLLPLVCALICALAFPSCKGRGTGRAVGLLLSNCARMNARANANANANTDNTDNTTNTATDTWDSTSAYEEYPAYTEPTAEESYAWLVEQAKAECPLEVGEGAKITNVELANGALTLTCDISASGSSIAQVRQNLAVMTASDMLSDVDLKSGQLMGGAANLGYDLVYVYTSKHSGKTAKKRFSNAELRALMQ